MKFSPLTRTVELYEPIKRIKIKTNCIIDSGSAVSLINFHKVRGCTISPLGQQLELTGAFGGTNVEMVGEICLYIYVDAVRRPVNFIVIDNCNTLQCILGWPDIQRLNLSLSHEGILTKERRLFGRVQPHQVKLVQKNDIQAVYQVDVSKSAVAEAVDLGNGIFETATSGLVRTGNSSEPTLIDDFTKSANLRPTPTKLEKIDLVKVEQVIEKAWAENKFCIDKSLSEIQRSRIRAILLKHKQCISIDKDEIGNLPNFVEEFVQEFDIPDPTPCPIYPVNPKKAQFLCEEIEKLFQMGVLKEFKTQVITSNLLAVPKKDGEWRAVSDLRWVNKHTKPTNLVLSRLDQISTKIMGKKFFVSVDVQKAYWSVKIPEEQKRWYTIQCPKCWKTYAWNRMVMGAKNAATVFSHMIQRHIVGDLHDHVTTYIDDITYSVDSVEKGIQTLDTLLERMERFGLKIGINKMQLFSSELDAFGFHFDKNGIKPMTDRISALSNRLKPATKKDLHSALASLNYFRGFIPNFSATAAPLYALTSEKVEYSQETVDKYWPNVLGMLKKTVQLQCPDYSKPMILSTDASCNGLGAVLSQEDDAGGRRIIGVHSMGLNSSEKLWAIAQKELKGIFEGLVKFEHILLNQPVIIETDNNSIFYLLKLRIGSVEINRRLPAVRFLLYISSFNFEVRHVSGKQPSFLLADFLSRQGYTVGEDSKFIMGNSSKQPLLSLKAMMNGKYDIVPVNMVTIADTRKTDYVDQVLGVHRLDKSMEELHQLIRFAQDDSKFCRIKKENPDGTYVVVKDVLYKTTNCGLMIVCPKFYSKTIVKYVHEAQHEGVRRTLEKLTKYKIWIYQKYRNVIGHVQNCRICDPARSGACLKAENNTVPNPRQPMDIIHVDLMNIGSTFVLVAVDAYSRFTMTRVMADGTSLSIKHALIEIFTSFGLPHTVCQDNGANLNSSVMTQFYDDLGITVSRTTVSNSRANSRAERQILELQMRTRQLGTENGHLHLNLYLITHKTNLTKPKKQKYSPFEIMFNRTSSWTLQLPELSKARRFAQDNDLRNMYNMTEEIQKEMNQMVERKRQAALKKGKRKQALKKDDWVRIKKFIADGNKKAFRPFSETVWKILSVNPYTNTCFLQEQTEKVFQPRIRKIHTRFLRKISPKAANSGDDLRFAEPSETKSKEEGPVDGKELKSEMSTKVKEDLNQLAQMADEMNSIKNKKEKKRKIEDSRKAEKNKKKIEDSRKAEKDKKRGSHMMTLRKRSTKGVHQIRIRQKNGRENYKRRN